MPKPIFLLPLLLSLAGCGDTHEQLLADQAARTRELVAALKSVRDEASARAAAPIVKRLEGELESIRQRMEKLGRPADSDLARLGGADKELEELGEQLASQKRRILADPALRSALSQALKPPAG